MAGPVVVILAAGKGTRMRSAVPKLLHPICGRPMIGWPVAAARAAGAAKIVVVDAPDTPLAPHLDVDVTVVVQPEARGTGDAVRAAIAEIGTDDTVVVLNGDGPLIQAETIRRLAAEHADTPAAATVVTAVLEDPAQYGRVVRDPDGNVLKIVEAKADGDATPEELRIHEVNSGMYVFDGATLGSALERIRDDNAQGEYYLPDVLTILRKDGAAVRAHQLTDPVEMWGINDRVQLAAVTVEAQRRILVEHMLAGVTVINPAATRIDAEVTLAPDVVIEPGSSLQGRTRVGAGSRIGPHSTLIDATVGETSVVIHSYLAGAVLEDHVSVGPFAYLRPGALLHDHTKAGTFVELKNTEVHEGAKVPHLSYIGDAEIGAHTNIGASTITANYDGQNKHRTTIGAHVHTSVDTTFVAPVTVGDHAWLGAGSVITDDVPPGALGIARPRQTNLEGYDARKKAAREQP